MPHSDSPAWRIKAVEREVSAGKQDPRDLVDVQAHGVITRPANSLCRSLAAEYAAMVDKPKRKAGKK
jgi:hypothetical protein